VVACALFTNHQLSSLLPILYHLYKLHLHPSPHTYTLPNRPPIPATTLASLRPLVSLTAMVRLSPSTCIPLKRYPMLAPFYYTPFFQSFVADYSLAATPIPTGSSTLPLLPLSHGSVSGPSQTINPSQNTHSGQPKSNSPPPPRCEVPAVPTAPGQVEKTVGRNTVNVMLPDVPMYHPLFLQWLHARRAWIIGQGYRDPLLVGALLLVQMFDRWLQHWWPLFHILCIGAPDTNPSGWVGIFDFWFVTLSTEHTPPPPALQTSPPNACARLMDPPQASDLAVPSPASTPSASRSKKNYRNEMSALNVQQIQQACTEAGGDADAIQRLAVVFPPGGVITRDALKVGRKPRVDHRGYQEFSVLVNGRWCCRLCNMLGRRTWKNEKDILNHVWNEHCDPPPSR